MFKLFVYGILKDRFEGKRACIKARCFHLGGFPAITEINTGWIVQGKIIEVDAPTLEELDQIEGYPDLYHRELIEIDGVFCQVYVYTGELDTKKLPKVINF